jgi:hypothetical protein
VRFDAVHGRFTTFKYFQRPFHDIHGSEGRVSPKEEGTMNWKPIENALQIIVRPGFVAATAIALMSGTAQIEAGQRDSGAQSQARQLQGTWRVQITLRNCQTGDALRPPFPAMATFAAGGTVITSDGGLSPLLRGAGHGAWRHTGGHAFEALTEAFLFTPAGAFNGTQRLRQSLEVGWDPDEFNATVSAEILDVQGIVLATGCATSVGRRMES